MMVCLVIKLIFLLTVKIFVTLERCSNRLFFLRVFHEDTRQAVTSQAGASSKG